MLTRADGRLASQKHPSMVFFMTFLLLSVTAFTAQSQIPQEPYAAADACVFFDDLEFNGTNANTSVHQQVNFGPRTTGSNASHDVRMMIHDALFQWDVENHTYTEDNLTFTNVVARHSNNAVDSETPRIVLVAHYDTRDVAERDSDPNRTSEAIPGANDGASGVAVLLELGRLIPNMNLPYQIELLFTDAEDQNHSSKLYGAEAWAARQTPADINRTTAYIVADMVGDADLHLTHVYPGDATLWSTISPLATSLGLIEGKQDCRGNIGRDVVNLSISTGVIDDHVPALNIGIPAIDLIDIRFGPGAEPFEGFWHTHEDTPDKVSADSLEDVGRLIELGLRSNAWIFNVSIAEEITPEPLEPEPESEAVEVEAYTWLALAALVGLMAALTMMLVLSRAVTLKPGQ